MPGEERVLLAAVPGGPLDQSNAFTVPEVPPEWWPYQGALRVKAGELPVGWRRAHH